MAKRKRKKNYRQTIINKLIKQNKNEIISGYFEAKDIVIPGTKKEQNIAISAFKRDIKGISKNNPELTPTEVFKKTFNTEKFTSRESRLRENFYQTQKKFFYREITRTYTRIDKKTGEEFSYEKTILMPKYKRNQFEWDKENELYKITYGPDKGKYVIKRPNPGQDPSYTLDIIDASTLNQYKESGEIEDYQW